MFARNSLWAMGLALLSSAVVLTAGDINMADETMALDPKYRNSSPFRDILVNNSLRESERRINWSGLQYCPKNVVVRYTPGESAHDVQSLSSTCPWFWTLNYDPTRSPSTILTAKCSCPKCLTKPESLLSRCQPIFYYRQVQYVKNNTAPILRLYPVSVGCTCERHAESGK